MESVSASLESQGYQCDAALDHQELIPFVKSYIFKRNSVSLSYFLLNVLFLILLIVASFIHVFQDTLTFSQSFLQVIIGFAITFLLIPLHEGLHGVAYRICGAKNVSFKANWKKLYFMAIADKFITTRKSFYVIGLTPFVVISLCLLILVSCSTPGMQIAWLSVLVMHASMCVGDFGLLSYFAENKSREVISFDDAENGISYFYSRTFK